MAAEAARDARRTPEVRVEELSPTEPCIVHLATPSKRAASRRCDSTSPAPSVERSGGAPAGRGGALLPLPLAGEEPQGRACAEVGEGFEAAACAPTGRGAARAGVAEGASDAESEDFSPRLPEEWQPLEYELWEQWDSLPPGFASRISLELQEQEQQIAQLRAFNSALLQKAGCPDDAPAAAQEDTKKAAKVDEPAAVPEPSEQQRPTGRPARGARGGVRISDEERLALRRATDQEEQKASHAAQAARLLDAELRQMRRSFEKALAVQQARLWSLEEQDRKLSREMAEDQIERKRLRQAEDELVRAKCHEQQLEAVLAQAEKRNARAAEEEKQLDADIAYLQEQNLCSRAQMAELDALDLQEQELRRELWLSRARLKAMLRGGLAAAAEVTEAPPLSYRCGTSPPMKGRSSPRFQRSPKRGGGGQSPNLGRRKSVSGSMQRSPGKS